jgi:hypothetical protein
LAGAVDPVSQRTSLDASSNNVPHSKVLDRYTRPLKNVFTQSVVVVASIHMQQVSANTGDECGKCKNNPRRERVRVTTSEACRGHARPTVAACWMLNLPNNLQPGWCFDTSGHESTVSRCPESTLTSQMLSRSVSGIWERTVESPISAEI